jgi:hypothetical protein
MIEFLNYSQGRDKMVKNFKFFHGLIVDEFTLYANGNNRMTVAWNGETTIGTTIDAEAELTRMMSEEITRGIDEEIINRLTRRINSGDNLDYFDRWMNMGGNTA